jgi:hypothetical protein
MRPDGGDVQALRDTDTLAFLVVHGGRARLERYFNGAQQDTLRRRSPGEVVPVSFNSGSVDEAMQRHGP